MICPICKKENEISNLYGYYKGQIFYIKGCTRCRRTRTIEDRHITIFTHDSKNDKYVPKLIEMPEMVQKLDPFRILVSIGDGGKLA